jgi:hypothetical protein
MKNVTSDLSALARIENPISLESIIMFAPPRDDSEWATDRYGRPIVGAPDVSGDLARRTGY